MTPVYVCTCASPGDPIRWHLFQACLARWDVERTVVHVVTNVGEHRVENRTPIIALDCDRKAFQGARRTWIEEDAVKMGFGVYVFADDDCLCLGKDFVERGTALMAKYPEYAVISARILPDFGPPEAAEDEIIERPYLTNGGINFVRAGILGPMLPRNGEFFDESTQAAALRSAGYRIGVARDLCLNHLGAFHSSIWPDDYRSGRTQVNNG